MLNILASDKSLLSPSLEDINHPISSYLEALDVFLSEQILHFEPEIQHLAEYCLLHKGKRLRPILTFYTGIGLPFSLDLVKTAAVVELIHLATLIHDDILDDGDTRHQMPTIHTLHGKHIAVLLGDAFFAKALSIAASLPTNYVCQAVSNATMALCSGEISQTLSLKEKRFSLNHYYRVIDLKTAELFATACQVGGYINHFSKEDIEKLRLFGGHLGRAYQLYDDYNDFKGDASVLGKTLGTDFDTHKYTLPTLLWLESMTNQDRNIITNKLINKELQSKEFLAYIQKDGILEQVRNHFYQEIKYAQVVIQGIAIDKYLLKLCDFFTEYMKK